MTENRNGLVIQQYLIINGISACYIPNIDE